MSEASPQRPAWQTEELQDEWVDLDTGDASDDDASNLTYGTRSISLTVPLPSHIHTNSDVDGDNSASPTSFRGVGTFLVREDVPNGPMLPKTPGRGRAGPIIKDFFTPLPLERMFEPPSPPVAPTLPDSPSDEIVETDMPNMVSFHGRKASIACQFTFAAPRGNASLNPDGAKSSYPQAQSTSTPPFAPNAAAPMTDPRLRLFQFQYDTFTREHLSALADSIAVNTPSAGMASDRRLSAVSEASFSHLRSTKRVKLSPPSEYGEGEGAMATIARPKIFGKAYVGESRSLMEKIKQARDFSTISTVASAHQSSPGSGDGNDLNNDNGRRNDNPVLMVFLSLYHLAVGDVPSNAGSKPPSSSGTESSGPYSSSTYRQQAAALMAQIKSDMKGNKRIFSGDSEMSHVTAHLDDENQRESSRHHRRTSSTSSARTRASPRRAPRQLDPTAEAEDEDELADDMSKLSVAWRPPNTNIVANPALLGPPAPAHPTTSLRAGTNEDLNRFVSSSTASGTTLTAGSVPSYVKHPGPAQIRTIAPKDVPALPERMGDMLFDKVMMRWVKSVQVSGGGEDAIEEEVSEDPFGDIESLRDDSRGGEDADGASETGDEEEMELTSFSTDTSGRVVAVMTGIDTDGLEDDLTTDSEGGNDAVVTGELLVPELQSEEGESDDDDDDDDDDADRTETADRHSQSLTDAFAPPPIVVTTFSTPSPPAPRSAMRASASVTAQTPTSVLKDASRARYVTPRRTHRRSVSFSDGKRDGPIQGLASAGVEPSARSKRIAEMLAHGDSSDDAAAESPTKPAEGSARVFARSQTHRPSPAGNSAAGHLTRLSSVGHASGAGAGHATFLTECSFGVAHDRLVQVLTDVEPFEPHWEELSAVDLAGRGLESAARLKEFLPRLDALNLNSNQLSWLSGVPSGVRTLSVASNCLTGLTSYSHLLNLENLDISGNEVDSLRQLAPLRHLRELRADGNALRSVEGLERLDGLMKLSLAGTSSARARRAGCSTSRACGGAFSRSLALNRIVRLDGLGGLPALVALNVDDNVLTGLALPAGTRMARLRILRASGNALRSVGLNAFPNLRTLYLDNNVLGSEVQDGEGSSSKAPHAHALEGLGRLARLENLSLRNQRNNGNATGQGRAQKGLGVEVLTREVRDVKRLYVSGNPLPPSFLAPACYHLVYLELAGCALTALPSDLASLVPNLRALNLNYNFVEDLRPLAGLGRLRKLSVVGGRVRRVREIIRVVRGLGEVEVLDFRMNPCTLGWYLPLVVRDVPGAGGGEGEDGKRWATLDSGFRRGLPDGVYVGRLAYRGLVMRGCGRLRVLDGVAVTEKERAKTQGVLAGLGVS
ncbi:hypothetical protein B0H10DRAFT_2215737 [Mycena sp. CBHHK59/15]|nr:hypothetical protein B0H10DRAFT_2215737 [Mycena sp. CBHHK59/15]